MVTLGAVTVRRFVLGRQGLWPGRRWRAPGDLKTALAGMEYLQLDPLQPTARSQDLQLASRVLDYRPGDWEEAAYTRREFFDWGAWLALRPMDELPHWKTVMAREESIDPRLRAMGRDHAGAIAEVRMLLESRGTLANRDFAAADRVATVSYRGKKDSSLALHYLWRTGEVMTHHRENFEKIYALASAVAPAGLGPVPDPAETDRFLVLKDIAFSGLTRIPRTPETYFRGVPFPRLPSILAELKDARRITEVRVGGWKPTQWMLTDDRADLDEVASGGFPRSWVPAGPTTAEEAVFLAPLDPVSARGRATALFGFDYTWEVYKPEASRKFGYYTLPVLWGDRLVARFDSKLDRATGTLVILGLWTEDPNLAQDAGFAEALGRGFVRFLRFLGAGSLDASAVREPVLGRALRPL